MANGARFGVWGACLLACLGWGAARGGERAELENLAPYEIVRWMATAGERSGAAMQMTVETSIVPGTVGDFALWAVDGVKRIRLDTGLEGYEFRDLAPLGGKYGGRFVLTADDGDRPALERVDDPPARLLGERVELFPGGAPKAVDAVALLTAGTMEEVRELAGEGGARKDGLPLLVPATLGETAWIAWVTPKHGPGDDRNSIGSIVLRTDRDREELKAAAALLAGLGYRPWFLRTRSGERQDKVREVRYAKEDGGRDAEAALIAFLGAFIEAGWNAKGPTRVEGLFVHPDDYAKAAAGQPPDPDAVALELRVTNGRMMELGMRPDGAARMQNPR